MSVEVRTPDGQIFVFEDAVHYEIDEREMLHVSGAEPNSYGCTKLAIYNAGAWTSVNMPSA